jgi:hypothetical protein
MKYKIIDWAYNRMFPNKTFNCIDTAWDFVCENCEGEKDEYGDIRHDDIFIVPSNTRCYHQGYWSTSN